MLNTETKLFAILGYPVKHSFSPQMQNKWFEKENLNCVYLAFEPKPEDLKKTVESLKLLGFQGVNITIPHKIEVMKYVDSIDKSAKKIGSVNTIAFKGGKLYGYNTDHLGFSQDLTAKKVSLKNKNVLVIGAGGGARAIVYALKESKAKNIYIANRTLKNAEQIVKMFKIKAVDINKIGEVLSEADLLVNTSACGMKKTDVLPFKADKIKNGLIVYDLIYNKVTPFTKLAEDKGLKIFTGVGMLIRQGACGFKIWTGKYPDIGIAERLLKEFIG
ncbi:MAG: shikimate dehydrogenase [Endomicrobium sp.]|jgi:shikimate dehydrogenase|nr:shikimate dehydrogenase [Endomicrobium sp.]